MALIAPGGAKNISLIASEMDPNLQPQPFLRLWNARLTTASLDWKQRAPFVFINGYWGKLGLHKVDGLPLGWWCIVVISGKPCIPWLLKLCTIAPKILIYIPCTGAIRTTCTLATYVLKLMHYMATKMPPAKTTRLDVRRRGPLQQKTLIKITPHTQDKNLVDGQKSIFLQALATSFNLMSKSWMHSNTNRRRRSSHFYGLRSSDGSSIPFMGDIRLSVITFKK